MRYIYQHKLSFSALMFIMVIFLISCGGSGATSDSSKASSLTPPNSEMNNFLQNTKSIFTANAMDNEVFNLLGITTGVVESKEKLAIIQNEVNIMIQNSIDKKSDIETLEGDFVLVTSANQSNNIFTSMNNVSAIYNQYISLIGVDGTLDDYLATNGKNAFDAIHTILTADTMNNLVMYVNSISNTDGESSIEAIYQSMVMSNLQKSYNDSTLDLNAQQGYFLNAMSNIAINIAKAQQEAYILELAATNINYNYATNSNNQTGKITLNEALNLSEDTYINAVSVLSDIFTMRNTTTNNLAVKYYQRISNSSWPSGDYKSSCQPYLNSTDNNTNAYYNGKTIGLYCKDSQQNLRFSELDLLANCTSDTLVNSNGKLQCPATFIYLTNNANLAESVSLYGCLANRNMTFTNMTNGDSSCVPIDNSTAGHDFNNNPSGLYAHDVVISGNYLYILSNQVGDKTWVQSCLIDSSGKLATCNNVYSTSGYGLTSIATATFGSQSYLYVANSNKKIRRFVINPIDGSLNTTDTEIDILKGQEASVSISTQQFDYSTNRLYFISNGCSSKNMTTMVGYCPIRESDGELNGSCSLSVLDLTTTTGSCGIVGDLAFYNSLLYISIPTSGDLLSVYDNSTDIPTFNSLYWGSESSFVAPEGIKTIDNGVNTYLYITNENGADVYACNLTQSSISGSNCVAANSGVLYTHNIISYNGYRYGS